MFLTLLCKLQVSPEMSVLYPLEDLFASVINEYKINKYRTQESYKMTFTLRQFKHGLFIKIPPGMISCKMKERSDHNCSYSHLFIV